MGSSLLNERLFEFIVDIIGEGVYIVDASYQIVYANSTTREMFFGHLDVLNRSIFDVFPDLTPEESSLVKVMTTGEAIQEKITTYMDGKGRRRTIICNTYPIVQDGIVVGAFEFGEDITGIHNLSEQFAQGGSSLKAPAQPVPLRQEKRAYYGLESIIGVSPEAKRLREEIMVSATSSSNLLIYGETGTGKELVAQAVYTLGKKTETAPFVAYNCAAIPEALLESILFGTVRGSFTGAENKPGLFELASGGVIFLDEINSMPLSLQAKILRVIEEGKVRRVGGDRETAVDFRLIASTNTNPERIVESGEMRTDLFYRLNVLNIDIPPLRERKEDIPVLAEYFIRELNPKLNKTIVGLHRDAIDLLIGYPWPGNVRELKNAVDRAMNFAKGKLLRAEDIKLRRLPTVCAPHSSFYEGQERVKLKETLAVIEADLIKQALKRSGGNVSQAARDLDIPQQTLNSKLDKYGLRQLRSLFLF